MRLIGYDRTIAERAIAKLPHVLSRASRLVAVLGAVGDVVQAAEDEFDALHNNFNLNNATGVALDIAGRRVGEARDGRADATYRRFIRARIQRNQSRGEGWRVSRIARLMLGGVVVARRRAAPRLIEIAIGVPVARSFAERAATRSACDEAATTDAIVHVLERVDGSFLSWEAADGAGWDGTWIELC